MAKTFQLTVAKIGETLFEGEAISLSVPGQEGRLMVLAHHEPLVTPLVMGTIRVESAEGVQVEIEMVEAGLLEVSGNQATVIL